MQTVVWFRRDLRIQDNKALYHACRDLGQDELILLFQANPEQFIEDSPNHQAFFASVGYFKEKIDEQAQLQVMVGEPVELFKKLKKQLPDWQRIYYNEDTSGFGAERDQAAEEFFKENKITSHAYQDAYLHGADEIKNQQEEHYKVFTPYHKKWAEQTKETPLKVDFQPQAVQQKVLFPKDEEQFKKMLKKLPENQRPLGEAAAKKRLEKFIKNSVKDYHKSRDIPSLDQTSHLSRFLRTGEISIRTVWQLVEAAASSEGRKVFQQELCWRDFYNMIYSFAPKQKNQPLQDQFQHIKWENDVALFDCWKQGQTGFPIVDAAMRQLQKTGWMHNRLRMIVASFLTKDLLIDWRWGEQYFQKMLIDYDPASNIGGWQWAASTGTDAVPYFRIFNPTTQSERFDQKGDFIREYVTELANVPNKFIHQPESLSKEEQEEYGVVLGEDYPKPIVDHKERRKQAISKYEASKEFARETSEGKQKDD
ncbi:cryptochrome/photolyase family protein [Enterococcus sp. LJL120]